MPKLKLDTFGEKLRYLRIERNLYQRELAHLLNRGFTTICNWEHGTVIPTPETIKEVGEILGVDFTFFKELE